VSGGERRRAAGVTVLFDLIRPAEGTPMNRPKIAFAVLALLASGAAPGTRAAFAADDTPPAPAPAESIAPEPAQPAYATDVLSAMDRSADPCTDFYRYACGGWLDATKLPADQSRWARSFSVIHERNRELVRDILEKAAADAPAGDSERTKIGRYYGACMDEAAIEKAGAEPLKPLLAKAAAADGPAAALALAGELQRDDVNAFFRLNVYPDFKHPGTDILLVAQGGLGLPDRDYYTSDDPKQKAIRAAYETHVGRMLELLGESAEAASADAARVVAFETKLAEASRTRTEMRDVEKLYHKIDRAGLQELTPDLPWERFFTAVGHPAIVDVNVATPEFFTALNAQMKSADPATLHAYLTWHVVHAAADRLSKAFVDEDFAFYGKTLSGQQQLEPRWKRCVDATENALGEAVGKVYVEDNFPGTSKQVAQEMIRDIEASFEANLPKIDWMDDTTRARARDKEHAIRNKIGFPDEWRDYSKMTVGRDSYNANALAAAAFETDRQLVKVGGPVDKGEWRMLPQTVNASYNPLFNEISFPAGILQPPFFNKDFPAAMNYGGIGAVVGHELTHGFDDQGRKFDPTGEMREWWEPEVSAKFQTRAQCVSDAYSAFEVEPGLHVNGDLTLGENIADLGGVKESFAAYKAWEQRHGVPPAAVPGLTDDQLFFVAFGQVWCAVTAPEAARVRVKVDPHSPPQFRAVGPLANNPDFATAFHCAAGTPMNPAQRCEVW
jgi:putative endopeptidase